MFAEHAQTRTQETYVSETQRHQTLRTIPFSSEGESTTTYPVVDLLFAFPYLQLDKKKGESRG
jgi:hypothetical protein